MRHFGIFSVLVWLVCTGASAKTTISPEPSLPEVTRGQEVTIRGKDFPSQDVKVYLRTGNEKAGDKGIERPATGVDDNTLKFTLQSDMPTGRYLVFVSVGTNELSVPGELRVLPDASGQVHIDAIHPPTVYPSEIYGRYDFEISGQNLGASPKDNIVEVVGKGPESMGTAEECATVRTSTSTPPAAKTVTSTSTPPKGLCLHVDQGMETRKLRVIGFQPERQGPLQFQVRVGNNVSNAVSVTFSEVSRWVVFPMAIGVFALLVGIVLLTVWWGVGSYEIGGKKYRPLSSFLLEKQTNSYSLSKFQLLAWTSVAVFGYVYLFLCRVLVQWNFQWPSIPDGLPALLGISAGTTVLAVGVTRAVGSKGAGPTQPSPADFISTGGLVASERFQFFVWTLVGCLGFIFLLIETDPATLAELPKVPDNFLYLMGFSSLGYLGGKTVRKPGPVIKKISIPQGKGIIEASATDAPKPPDGVTATGTLLTINLEGENLDPKANVKVDNKLLGGYQFWITGTTSDPQSGFCTQMTATLNDASAYLEGERNLTLVNSDGQAADVKFPVDPMSIDSGECMPKDDAHPDVRNIVVKGKNFGEGTTAEWRANQQVVKIPSVTKENPGQLTLKEVPETVQGTGKLILTSMIGLKASKDIKLTR